MLVALTGPQTRAPMHECDKLAADAYDREAVAPGVALDAIYAARAVPACEAAIKLHPAERRFAFQLGRALDAAKQSDKAKVAYEAQAANGHGSAMLALATMNYYGRGVPKNNDEGNYWLRNAVEAGNLEAMNQTAHWTYNGATGFFPSDAGVAVRLWRRAVELGHTTAMVRLAEMHDQGRGGLKPDATTASFWVLKALNAGDGYGFDQMLRAGGSGFTPAFRKEMQQRLKDLDLYSGPIDGQFAQPTLTAIEALKHTGR